MQHLKSRSLSKDMMIIVLVIIIISLFVSSWLIFKIYANQKQSKTTLLRTTANRVEDILSEDVKYVSYQMQYISNLIKQKGATNENIEQFLRTFEIDSKINVAIAWNMFSWVDKNQFLTVDGVEGILSEAKDLSSRDYIPDTIKNPGKLFMGQPVYGAVSNQWIIPAGMGVVDKKGNYVGSIVFGFDIKSLIYKLETAIGDQNIYFALINENNDVIFESSNVEMYDRQKILQEVIDNKHNSFTELNTHQPLFSNNLGYIHYRKLNATINNSLSNKIGLIVVYNKESSYRQMFNLLAPYIIDILIVLSFFGLLLILIHKRILRPIVDLSQAADDILAKKKEVRYPENAPLEILKVSDQLRLISIYEKGEKYLIKSKEKIASESKAKTKLINVTSHDLRNYIFGISGLSKLALEGKTDAQIQEDESLRLVLEISKQSEELMQFVEDLLDTNYNDYGNFSLKKIEKCDVKNLIQRMITFNSNFAIQHKISLKSDIEEGLPYLQCDQRRMKQILGNLISNAIKYSQEGQEVVIKAHYRKQDNKMAICVQDNGIGMSEEEVKMALSGFGSDIDKSNLNKAVDSYGLGLPNVKHLVELHHGVLEIKSKKNQGTQITIMFDIDNVQETKSEDNASKENSVIDLNGIATKSILVADDNAVNIKIICAILRRSGYLVKHVADGQAALEELDKAHFDLIILDGQMPVLDGWETARKIREGKIFKNFKNYHNIPILAFMGSSSPEILEKNKESGMNYMITKNSHPKEILDIVRNFFEDK